MGYSSSGSREILMKLTYDSRGMEQLMSRQRTGQGWTITKGFMSETQET
jgi:hypothetical protein